MTTLSAIKSWIELVTGYASSNVVIDYGNGPEPTGDYAAFGDPIADEELVIPFSSTTVVDGNATIIHYVQTQVSVPINIYATDGASKLRSLALSPGGYAPRKLLSDGGLVYNRKSAIRNLSGFDDTGAKHRFQADFEFVSYDEWTEYDWEVQRAIFNGELDSDGGPSLVDEYDIDFT